MAYVGGPAEIAYHGQMKKVYEFFGLDMPLLNTSFHCDYSGKKSSTVNVKISILISALSRRFSITQKGMVEYLTKTIPEAKLDELEQHISRKF